MKSQGGGAIDPIALGNLLKKWGIRDGFQRILARWWGREMRFSTFHTASRWRRPGVRRELPAKLYDGDAVSADGGPNPGASARNR